VGRNRKSSFYCTQPHVFAILSGFPAIRTPNAGRYRFATGPLSVLNGLFNETAHLRKYFMVVIRLARGGARNRPFYNIVVADSRNPRDGRFIERLGFYNPVASGADEAFRMAMDRLTFWQGRGAQPSDAVLKLIKRHKKTAPVVGQ
jgi:small subunit ribosomal protein S16